AHAILESVELAPLAGDRAETLSGGQKKLLELARALMSEPRIILLDEPGAGVNPTLMRSLVEAIRALRAAGRTFLLIEHDMDLVRGPTGAGKSTLLKALAGLVRPRGGRIVLRGADITEAGTRRIVESGLCYVPQEANVFPSLSVWENLTIGAWTASGSFDERVGAVVELFPILAGRRRARAGTLSGGERQMLAIAMALMVQPCLL